jgi:membrane-associated phospholipid phosphatase
VPRARLGVIALACLYATALLASAVAHGSSPYGFEDPAINWLGPPSATRGWADFAERLATPTIIAVLVVSFGVGLARRAFVRVAFYAALAAWTLVLSEHVIKPLVQRTYYGELTFPSGNVTAVSATALAMWLALAPLLSRVPRYITLLLGVEWVLLVSLAVVGARWHTPLDAIGSVLLSIGVVTAGAAVFEPAGTPGSCEAFGRELFGEQAASSRPPSP